MRLSARPRRSIAAQRSRRVAQAMQCVAADTAMHCVASRRIVPYGMVLCCVVWYGMVPVSYRYCVGISVSVSLRSVWYRKVRKIPYDMGWYRHRISIGIGIVSSVLCFVVLHCIVLYVRSVPRQPRKHCGAWSKKSMHGCMHAWMHTCMNMSVCIRMYICIHVCKVR